MGIGRQNYFRGPFRWNRTAIVSRERRDPVQDVRGQSEPECAHGELFSRRVRDVRAVHAV